MNHTMFVHVDGRREAGARSNNPNYKCYMQLIISTVAIITYHSPLLETWSRIG